MSPIAFQTIEGRVAFVKEINFSQSLKLFLVLLRMYKNTKYEMRNTNECEDVSLHVKQLVTFYVMTQ